MGEDSAARGTGGVMSDEAAIREQGETAMKGGQNSRLSASREQILYIIRRPGVGR
jgi:hypothetical protein